jgi:hypothetical protein
MKIWLVLLWFVASPVFAGSLPQETVVSKHLAGIHTAGGFEYKGRFYKPHFHYESNGITPKSVVALSAHHEPSGPPIYIMEFMEDQCEDRSSAILDFPEYPIVVCKHQDPERARLLIYDVKNRKLVRHSFAPAASVAELGVRRFGNVLVFGSDSQAQSFTPRVCGVFSIDMTTNTVLSRDENLCASRLFNFSGHLVMNRGWAGRGQGRGLLGLNEKTLAKIWEIPDLTIHSTAKDITGWESNSSPEFALNVQLDNSDYSRAFIRFNAQDGTVKWSLDGMEVTNPLPTLPHWTAEYVRELPRGRVNAISRIDMEIGKLLWTLADMTTEPSVDVLDTAKHRLSIFNHNVDYHVRLVKFDKSAGAPIWSVPLAKGAFGLFPNPDVLKVEKVQELGDQVKFRLILDSSIKCKYDFTVALADGKILEMDNLTDCH